MPCVLNAANEVGVEAFLAGRLRFTDIARVIAETMDGHDAVHVATLETVREVDRWARACAASVAGRVQSAH
jgi:1-deoxy-D-xylulose-5-phosphate reductoisomerase